MSSDLALNALLPYLQKVEVATLWFADEQAATVIDQLCPNDLLTIVSNRFDIAETLQKKGFTTYFNDFDIAQYRQNYQRIVYRISKEKALVNHLLNQSQSLLKANAELVISGYKQEGIKSYSDNLIKHCKAGGKLKKNGAIYLGQYYFSPTKTELDDNAYQSIRKISIEHPHINEFYSKPGVYGWNKIDRGSELLLQTCLPLISNDESHKKTVLDLGCGYGWITINAATHNFQSITAVDNNAAAVLCARKNTETLPANVTVVASDCDSRLEKQYDIILCNPPFHQGFKHSQTLTKKFIAACKNRLTQKGKAFWVLNEFIGLADVLANHRLQASVLEKKAGFKVILIEHSV